jgi:transcriptional regulator with XRE-family HTH domain
VWGVMWHRAPVNELRELPRNANLTQRDLAELLKIPLNTFRMWDSGLRPPPVRIVGHTRDALAAQAKQHQLLSLAELAKALGVHVRTLQAAARTGRLETQFSVRSVFGRPIRYSSRAAGEQFMVRHYGCFSGQEICPPPLPTVPDDYDKQLRDVRRRRGLTQAALARCIGAAGKPSSISRNHGSERRRLCCGNVSSNWKAASPTLVNTTGFSLPVPQHAARTANPSLTAAGVV